MRFDPRPADTRPWLALAGATGCFLGVSLVSIGPDSLAGVVTATVLAGFGGGLAALWADRVARRTHAVTAFGLWCLVIASSAATVVRTGNVTAPGGIETVSLWTIGLLATVATLYLGLREYGSTRRVVEADRSVDGDV